MKKTLAVLLLCTSLLTLSLDADAAKRFGGGASFGRSAPTFTQKAPTFNSQQTPVKPAASPNQRQQQAANTANAPQAQRPSMMRSMLTGIAAALGISALLSMLGINGSGMVSLIMGVLLALILFAVVRAFMARRALSNASDGSKASPSWSSATPSQPEDIQSSERSSQVSPVETVAPRQGSVMDQFASPQASGSFQQTQDITPADFDKKTFLEVALENYKKLQKAWDSGNVLEISDFTTSDVFTAITHQLRERGAGAYQSEVLDLQNELLGIAQEGNVYLAAVKFTGHIKFGDETEQVAEIWTLEKQVDGSSGWLLAGIKQMD